MIPIICIAVFVAGALLFRFADDKSSDGAEMCAIALIMVGGFATIMSLIAIPINRAGVRSEMVEFTQTQKTIEFARSENGPVSPIELAALQQKVIECNEWLASTQYWARKPLLRMYFPQDVLKLEMIQ
jgi:hypothetical protein